MDTPLDTSLPARARAGSRLRTPGPVLAAALGAGAIAFSAILVKLADVSPSTAAVFRCAYAVPVLWLLSRREDRLMGSRSRHDRFLAWGAGVFFAVDLILWHHAIEAVGAGLATVLANTQVVFVGLIAWALLREKPATSVFFAVPIVLFGVVFVSGALGEGAYGDDPVLGVILGTGTALAYSGFLLILRHGGGAGNRPAGPLFDATLSGGIFSAIAGLALGEVDFAPTWPEHGWLIVLALTSQVIGWLLITASLPRLPAVTTSVLLTIQPAGSVILGILLLSEEPSALQLVGVVLILAGVVVATAGRRKANGGPATPDPELSGAS